jgi:divalent metal cation (Fe/Co/Zn/Cd) transporter
VRREIERVVAQYPALSRPHNIHLRRNPDDNYRLYIFLEAAISPDTPITEAHSLASQVELELSQRLPEVAEVSVHLEPPDQD